MILLTANYFGTEGVTVLCGVLGQLTQLTTLNLEGLYFGGSAVIHDLVFVQSMQAVSTM